MIILSIDTSQSASVALVDTDSDTVIAAEQADDQRRHVEFIGPALARVLKADVLPELVVVGIGPGPFTGLRVGIAAGIAVGQARGIPVRGLLSQAAIAEELLRTTSDSTISSDNATASDSATATDSANGTDSTPGTGHPVLIASDARRKEVYFSVYDAADASLSAGPFVARPSEVAAVLDEHGYVFDRIADRLGRGFLLYPETLGAPSLEDLTDPRADYLALAAARELAAGRELSDPIPEYLRDPDAKPTPVRGSSLR
ncbi:tRNA (adenosine(37)-N6)-threonylcarbamoyltransferase complex dimerization subunit type 1 TsaB [Brevibacterium atlanticum]|uniref:tRNA (adenosine(37)-N6)-threonylcarbamoyltransferase complex dimerization subunit type 1 TsaB n=1 Tax=Brevibacterium atlanticum TaxID=2697563 RepID=UPI001423C0C7|nr:tRNA (adenosine(37)-N6)-threonylcarbamoyltransferase complex dimerization subunit type 1 TsaB [Brevibacterium atlanticum]